MQILQPPEWARPVGYSNGVAARGTQVFVAGTVGWNEQCEFEAEDLVGQIRQALINIKQILAEAGAEPRHLVRLTWYILDREDYLAKRREIGAAYREVMGKSFPPMAMLVVAGLIESKALVEIEATAVIED